MLDVPRLRKTLWLAKNGSRPRQINTRRLSLDAPRNEFSHWTPAFSPSTEDTRH